MLRTTRSTQTSRAADRMPIIFTAAGAIVMAAAFACAVKSDSPRQDTTVVSAVPAVVSKPDTAAGEVEALGGIPANVSFASAEFTYNQRRYREATEMFEVYVQRRPDNAWGHYMLGLAAWKAGELAVARAALERSLEIEPTHVKSLLNLTRVLIDQGQPKEALERITEAVAIDPSLAEVHRLAGRVYTALGESETAIEAYEVALSLDSTDVWSMNNMALVFIQEGEFEEALGPLARAVQLRPTSPVFQNNLGVALERSGHFVAAAAAYRAALSADSTYAKAALSLARVSDRIDDPSIQPVELTSLAESFKDDIRWWNETYPLPATAVIKPDSIRPRER